jgi:membrane-associated protease RseP (regulator of RpoE activity)/DNA-directed RNA polymerase subunit RPC12/RpoP
MRIYKCPQCGFSQATEEELWECPKCRSPLLFKGINMEKIEKLVSTYFTYTEYKVEDSVIIFKVQPFVHDFETVRNAFESQGYYPFLRKKQDQHFLILAERVKQGSPNIMWNVLLLVATIASTLFAGYSLSLSMVEEGLMTNVWAGAVSFSAAIMFILGTHEMGHKYASYRNGVDATWPYFIPMPFFIIGTMGAVIKSRSPMPNSNSMIQLGASGPLCGFLVAVPLFILGLKLSYVVPHLEPAAEQGMMVYFGQSLLTGFLGDLLLKVPEGHGLMLHPVGIAAWAALLVTSVNLIPIGQLDGGHIARALLGEKVHRIVSHVLIGVMVVMGFPYYNPLFVWEGWFVWALLLYFVIMRAGSGGAMNELQPISGFNKVLALAALTVFVLTVIPIPLQIIQ